MFSSKEIYCGHKINGTIKIKNIQTGETHNFENCRKCTRERINDLFYIVDLKCRRNIQIKK